MILMKALTVRAAIRKNKTKKCSNYFSLFASHRTAKRFRTVTYRLHLEHTERKKVQLIIQIKIIVLKFSRFGKRKEKEKKNY